MSKFNKESLKQAELNVITECMKENRYNQSKVSRILGISRQALRYKLLNEFDNEYVGGNSWYTPKGADHE